MMMEIIMMMKTMKILLRSKGYAERRLCRRCGMSIGTPTIITCSECYSEMYLVLSRYDYYGQPHLLCLWCAIRWDSMLWPHPQMSSLTSTLQYWYLYPLPLDIPSLTTTLSTSDPHHPSLQTLYLLISQPPSYSLAYLHITTSFLPCHCHHTIPCQSLTPHDPYDQHSMM